MWCVAAAALAADNATESCWCPNSSSRTEDDLLHAVQLSYGGFLGFTAAVAGADARLLHVPAVWQPLTAVVPGGHIALAEPGWGQGAAQLLVGWANECRKIGMVLCWPLQQQQQQQQQMSWVDSQLGVHQYTQARLLRVQPLQVSSCLMLLLRAQQVLAATEHAREELCPLCLQLQQQQQLDRHHVPAVKVRAEAYKQLGQSFARVFAASEAASADHDPGAVDQAGGSAVVVAAQADAAAEDNRIGFGAFLEALCAAVVAAYDLLLLGDEDLMLQLPSIVPYGGKTADALVQYAGLKLQFAEAAVRRGDWADGCKAMRDLEGKLRYRHIPVVLGTEWGPPQGFTQPGG
jgi:hypothetical protein